LLLSHSWWQNSEELGEEGIGRGSDTGVEWVLASASVALCSARIASCSSIYWLGSVLTVYLKGVGMHSPIWSARGQLRSSTSISSPIVLGDIGGLCGAAKKCSDSVRRGIGIGDGDVDKRLAKFVIGEHGSEVDLVPTNGAGGVNKGWVGLVALSKGGVVGEDVPTLVDLGDKGVVIFLFSIGCDKWGEDIWGNKRYVVRFWSLFCMLFILLVPLNSAKSSGVCKSSTLTHESCVGEYPFYLTRYSTAHMCTL